jgi:hypothetical protein
MERKFKPYYVRRGLEMKSCCMKDGGRNETLLREDENLEDEKDNILVCIPLENQKLPPSRR